MNTLYEKLTGMGKVGTNEKIKLLSELSLEHQEMVTYILDPYRRYGISNTLLLGAPCETNQVTWSDVKGVLDRLASRDLSGKNAENAIMALSSKMDYETQNLFCCIMLKDTKAGIGVSMVNKAFKNKIDVFEVQLATNYRQKGDTTANISKNPKAVFPLIGQQKLDGMRIVCEVDVINAKVQFLSRTGNEVTSLNHLKPKMLRLATATGHSFIYFDGEGTAGSFNGTVSALRKKNVDAIGAEYWVFDWFLPEWRVQYKADKKKYLSEAIGQQKRLEELRINMIYAFGGETNDNEIKFLPYDIYDTHEEYVDKFKQRLDNNEEGEMGKDPNAPYEFKRTKNWWKLKDEQSQDGTIVGFKAGDPNSRFANTLGSVTVELESGVVVEAAGIKHQYLDEIWNNQDKYIGRVVEVHYHEETPDGSLRHPRLKWPQCLRDSENRIGDKE